MNLILLIVAVAALLNTSLAKYEAKLLSNNSNLDFIFVPSFRSNWSFIGLPNAYSYEPSAMVDDGSGLWKIWWCGNTKPAVYEDMIFYAEFAKNGGYEQPPINVMHPEPSDRNQSTDGAGTCNPSVVKHSNPQIGNNATLYLMYFECGPLLYDRNPQNFGQIAPIGFTQTCLAFSADGRHWQKYNSTAWTNEMPPVTIEVSPTPVIPVSRQVLCNCEYKFDELTGVQTIDTSLTDCSLANAVNNYGSGHPSALVIQNEIWVYYYDSMGSWAQHGVFLVKSWDGFHFTPPVKTNLPNGASVKFDSTQNLFLAISGMDRTNVLFISTDGISFSPAPSFSSPTGVDLRVAVSSHCSAPGQNTIVGDPSGQVNSLYMNIFSAEGFMGKSDGCDNASTCFCFNASEDVSRGITWKIYLIEGQVQLFNSESFILPVGPFNHNMGSKIYLSNGRGQYCWFATWEDFVEAGYRIGQVASTTAIPSSMLYTGPCATKED